MRQVPTRSVTSRLRPCRASGRRGPIIAIWLMLAWATGLNAAETPTGGIGEYQLKATFLVRFLDFVHWPATKDRDRAEGVIIGVLGQDPFGPDLAKVTRDGRRPSRSIAWKHCRDVEEARQCHILFVSRRETTDYKPIFAGLGASPVLTVGEGQEFTRLGGMIGMLSADRRVQIEINTNQTARAGLRIDPQLLQLARIVRDAIDQEPVTK